MHRLRTPAASFNDPHALASHFTGDQGARAAKRRRIRTACNAPALSLPDADAKNALESPPTLAGKAVVYPPVAVDHGGAEWGPAGREGDGVCRAPRAGREPSVPLHATSAESTGEPSGSRCTAQGPDPQIRDDARPAGLAERVPREVGGLGGTMHFEGFRASHRLRDIPRLSQRARQAPAGEPPARPRPGMTAFSSTRGHADRHFQPWDGEVNLAKITVGATAVLSACRVATAEPGQRGAMPGARGCQRPPPGRCPSRWSKE